MSKVAIEQIFNGSIAEGTSYLSTRITTPPLPTLIKQWNMGSNPGDKFLGPMPASVLRPFETSVPFVGTLVHVYQWSATEWWVFYAEGGTAAVTRRIGFYKFNPVTNGNVWQGYITLTYPTATAHTIRGFRLQYQAYTTGTAAVSTTAVTGTGTAWSTSRLAVGSRIGFGSTDPTQITTWYEISAVGSDTSITLTATAGTITNGPYVIEELRCLTVTTNATTTNGGLYVTKGLRPELFSSSGFTVPAATTVDNIRAVYWLKDAATETNITACGMMRDDPASFTSHDIYVANGGGTASLILYRYNARAALTLTAGAATLTAGADLTITGAQAVTGNLSQNGNGRIDIVNHGPGSGVKSLYLVTASRIIRVAATNVVAASTTFISDQMTENPPGTSTTYPLYASFSSIETSSAIDRFVVSNGAAARHYLTQYRTDAGQLDTLFLSDDRQQDQSTESATATPHPTGAQAVSVYFWAEGGVYFMIRQGTTAAQSQIYIWPGGAHWDYVATSGQQIIFPAMSLGSVPSKFYRIVANSIENLGSSAYGKAPEPYRLKYRTSGITDNSGSWTLVPVDGDLSGVSAAATIQFAAEFKTLGDVCIPARLVSLMLAYETADALPSQFRWNFSDSNATSGIFAWIQATTFGVTPTLETINIYRADTNALVLTQASSATTNGTFEYWTGSAWAAGVGPDTVGTRRRFNVSASLPASVELYATITVS